MNTLEDAYINIGLREDELLNPDQAKVEVHEPV